MFTADGLSKDPEMGTEGQTIEYDTGNGKTLSIPKLNLSVIYMQQKKLNRKKKSDESDRQDIYEIKANKSA